MNGLTEEDRKTLLIAADWFEAFPDKLEQFSQDMRGVRETLGKEYRMCYVEFAKDLRDLAKRITVKEL